MNDEQLDALTRVLRHYWDDEREHCSLDREDKHIFFDLKVLKGYLDTKRPEGTTKPAKEDTFLADFLGS